MDRVAFTRNTLRDFVSHFRLWIADIYIVRRTKEHADNLGFTAHGLAAARRAEHKAVGASGLLAVQQDHVAGQGVEAVNTWRPRP